MKNIVMCSDGTGNEYGTNSTNVVGTYALALKTATQLAYYDPGVATGGWAYDEESGVLGVMTNQGTGAGLQKNVNDAYRYLMEVYEGPEANRIFLFGFGGGAPPRSLAAMPHNVRMPLGETGSIPRPHVPVPPLQQNARQVFVLGAVHRDPADRLAQ